jgi:hypothetical protein
MKHPDQETWLGYLYEEQLAPERKADIEAHLTACPDCRRRFESWQAVRHRLNAWSLPAHRSRPTAGVPWLRLAAMLLLLAVGVVLGRYALGAQSAAESLRVQLREELTVELRSELERSLAAAQEAQRSQLHAWLTDFARLQEDQRSEDLTLVHQAMLRLDTERRLDHARLRQDVETVALLTDASFRLAHEQLLQLAAAPGGPVSDLSP